MLLDRCLAKLFIWDCWTWRKNWSTGESIWRSICLLSTSSPLVPSSPLSSPVPESSLEWALSLETHESPPTRLPRLHRHPSIHRLHWAPSSLRLRLGRASTRHRLGTPLLWLRLVTASHRLRWAPSSHQLHLGPQSLTGSLALRLRLGPSTTCSATIRRPPGVGGHPSSMAPPSVSSTVGRQHGCGMGPTWLLLFRLPPLSSLAPPSPVELLRRGTRLQGGGSNVTPLDCFALVFVPVSFFGLVPFLV